MASFVTYIAGINMHAGADVIESIPIDSALRLEREPNNAIDVNAVLIYHGKHKLGYIPALDAKRIARIMDDGGAVGVTLIRVWKEKRDLRTSIQLSLPTK